MMRRSDHSTLGRIHGEQFGIGAGLLSLLILLTFMLALPGVAGAAGRNHKTDLPPMSNPTPETVNLNSSEATALYELARELQWPTTVWRDYSGRLYVEDRITPNDWERAITRPFDFSSGAEAAFRAEQEDARIAGYDVTPTTFLGYPAYWARLPQAGGTIVERRLHWLAESWILGAEVAGESRSDAHALEIGQTHARFSRMHGIPLSGTRTPSPTTAPPNATVTPPATVTRPSGSSTPRPTSTAAPCPTFSDVVPGHWAAAYIRDIACRGIVSGYADGTFRPQSEVTRGQLVKIIVLSEGFPILDPFTPSFSDVARGNVYYKYIETANARRIISGYADRTFRPYENVKRAQIAKIIVLARRWSLLRPTSDPACDVPRSYWAAEYIYTAMARNALTGYSNGCFEPDAYATRAQIAKILVTARP